MKHIYCSLELMTWTSLIFLWVSSFPNIDKNVVIMSTSKSWKITFWFWKFRTSNADLNYFKNVFWMFGLFSWVIEIINSRCIMCFLLCCFVSFPSGKHYNENVHEIQDCPISLRFTSFGENLYQLWTPSTNWRSTMKKNC